MNNNFGKKYFTKRKNAEKVDRQQKENQRNHFSFQKALENNKIAER